MFSTEMSKCISRIPNRSECYTIAFYEGAGIREEGAFDEWMGLPTASRTGGLQIKQPPFPPNEKLNMNEGIQFLSLGGGVDSTALLAMHLCRDEATEILGITREELDAKLPNFEWVVFSDPGSEWASTYENIEYARTICKNAGLNFQVVYYEQRYFRHKETNERIKDWSTVFSQRRRR